MSQRLTEQQLRKIIREEYTLLASANKNVLTEAQANHLADELLEEGLFDNIKSLFAGAKGGAGAAAKKLGDKAVSAMKPLGQYAQNMAKQAKQAASDFGSFVDSVKDEAVKSAIEARKESMKNSVQAAVKKEVSSGLQDLTKAGVDPKEAKGIVSMTVNAALAEILGQ